MFNSNVKCIETIVCKFVLPWNISFKNILKVHWLLLRRQRFCFFLPRSPRTFVLGVCTFGEQENGVMCFRAATNAHMQPMTVIVTVIYYSSEFHSLNYRGLHSHKKTQNYIKSVVVTLLPHFSEFFCCDNPVTSIGIHEGERFLHADFKLLTRIRHD